MTKQFLYGLPETAAQQTFLASAEAMIKDYLTRQTRSPHIWQTNIFHNEVMGMTEKVLLRVTLEVNNDNQRRSAQQLGLGRATLRRKREQYGLVPQKVIYPLT